MSRLREEWKTPDFARQIKREVSKKSFTNGEVLLKCALPGSNDLKRLQYATITLSRGGKVHTNL